MSHRFDFRRCGQILLLMVSSFAFPVVVLSQSAPVSAILAISEEKLVVGSDHGLFVHDGITLKREKKLETKIEKTYALKVSANGQRLAVSGGTPAELGIVEIYSLPGYEMTHRFERFNDVATDVAWISNDQLVACSMTGDCCLVSLDPHRLEHQKPATFDVHSKGVLSIEVLGNGQIVSGGLDSTIRVWELNQPTSAQVLNNHVNAVNDIEKRHLTNKRAPEMIVSSSDDGTIRFWQPGIGRMIRFARLDAIPTCVIWNHDGTLAIAGCRDGAIRLVNPDTAQVVRTIKGSSWIHCLAAGSDPDKIYVGRENGISIVELNPVGR